MTEVLLRIEKLVPGGMGLARLDGRVVFVPGTAPGDRIRARIEAEHRQHMRARCLEILEPGPDTVDPGCEHDGVCGGCQMRRLSPAMQETIKEGFVREGLERIAHLDAGCLRRLLPATTRDGYRRRATLQVHWNGTRILLGFFAHNSHDIVDLTGCPVLDPRLASLLAPLRRHIATLECRDQLSGIEVVAGDTTLGMVFCLLRPASRADMKRMGAFAAEREIAQLWVRIGKAMARPLTNNAPLSYGIAGLELTFAPEDFVQGHAGQNRVLVEETLRLAGKRQMVWDLFCGIGNFTLPLARQSGMVMGVDLVSGALRRAAENARRQGMRQIQWLQRDLFRPEGLQQLPTKDPVDLVVLDPPRNGAEALCRYLATNSTGQVVYVSCDPATFARDAAILVAGGYGLELVQPVDLFPQTRHVEMVSLFKWSGEQHGDGKDPKKYSHMGSIF
ncbi:MAG: 23S rRNA (uracil(1939)-C(5))-methyltransferase RlmD [Magnetococcales bacterium]|nr:23S rRNA (uracil(1939)-C(5))-methyltransferase RlmD [Magnetococcales bacterium]